MIFFSDGERFINNGFFISTFAFRIFFFNQNVKFDLAWELSFKIDHWGEGFYKKSFKSKKYNFKSKTYFQKQQNEVCSVSYLKLN